MGRAFVRVEEKMALFSKKKNQVIKFEQNLCNADVNDNQVLFVRVSDIVEDKEAILEVPFTHNALLIKGGGDCRLYKSGTHPVFDDKNEIKNWKKGISIEVIYIPKETSVKIEWGTPNKGLLHGTSYSRQSVGNCQSRDVSNQNRRRQCAATSGTLDCSPV